ncbi:MAG: hypothetical protein ACXVCY_04710 [Pseudobdellovibrionaceae bacterium]
MSLKILLISLFSFSAFASHPHDSICVGTADLGDFSRSFVLQHAIGRTYQNGNPNLDPHIQTVEARSCPIDYSDELCGVYKSQNIITKPGATELNMVLKNKKGEVFFNGKLDFQTEKPALIGEMNSGPINENKMVKVHVDLSCVGQPWLNLTAKATDGL